MATDFQVPGVRTGRVVIGRADLRCTETRPPAIYSLTDGVFVASCIRMRVLKAEIITLSPLSCSYLARIQLYTKVGLLSCALKRPLKCHRLDVGKLNERRPPGSLGAAN